MHSPAPHGPAPAPAADQRSGRYDGTVIVPGAKTAFRVSSKSKARFRLSADGHLVKEITTGKTWLTLRCVYDRSLSDRLWAALKALHIRRDAAARCGIKDAQLVVTRDHTGEYRIGLRFIADVDGSPAPLSVPAAAENMAAGYRLHRNDPDGWRETVAFCFNRALYQYADTAEVRAQAETPYLGELMKLRKHPAS